MFPLFVYGQTANEYFDSGNTKAKFGDYKGAITDYTKAISLNPDFPKAYLNRGVTKSKLKDYYGAIADYTKAIEIDPDYANAYFNRANGKYFLGLNSCKDYSKSCELGYQKGCEYFNQDCK